MSLHYDESRPSSLQRQIEKDRRSFRKTIAARAVPDTPVRIKPPEQGCVPFVGYVAPRLAYRPVDPSTIERDWLILGGNVELDESFPADIIGAIFTVVSKYTGVSKTDLRSARRTYDLVIPRHIAFYLCKHFTIKSYPEIGRYCGGRDHATGIHAVRKTQARMLSDAELCQSIAEMSLEIETYIAEWRAPRTRAKIAEYVAQIRAI